MGGLRAQRGRTVCGTHFQNLDMAWYPGQSVGADQPISSTSTRPGLKLYYLANSCIHRR